MSYLFGTFIGFFSLYLGLRAIHQSVFNFVDEVALTVVIGGTFAIAVILLPWKNMRYIRQSLMRIVWSRQQPKNQLVKQCLEFVRRIQNKEPIAPVAGFTGQILKDGSELIELGFAKQDIEEILKDRINHQIEMMEEVSNAFRSMAKYPPAFGLMGTVFGLVELMKAITEGLDPSQTGARMAIALVATLYGLVMANFVIAPLGESMQKVAREELATFRICFDAVRLSCERVSLLKAQEILNSHLPDNRRVNYIANMFDIKRDEAA